MSHALARLVNDFFAVPAISRNQKERLAGPEPFSRESAVYLNTWRPWVADGGVSLRRRVSFQGIRDERREAALSVLTELEAEGKARRGRLAGVIGRARLEGLSRAASVGDPASLVRLWVATMMWGSGTTNGRGPRYTAQGLSDDHLIDALSDTATLIREGKVADAWESFHVSGCGESFFTKWFWTVSLASPNLVPRPLILDSVVRATLAAAREVAPDLGWSGGRGGGDYARYVALMHDTAALANLGDSFDAERLEILLFGDTANAPEMSFPAWLKTRPRP